MLSYRFNQEQGLIHLRPGGPLSKENFEGLSAVVDPYTEAHGELAGIIIEADKFPGWENLKAAIQDLRFVHDNHRKIKKVTIVTDSLAGDLAEDIASYFVAAEIRHFKAHHDLMAHDWILSR